MIYCSIQVLYDKSREIEDKVNHAEAPTGGVL